MTFFKSQKTLLAVSVTAAMAGSFVTAHAQAVNDRGALNFTGQIASTTCVLDLGDTASTSLGSRTLNLGNYTTAAASAVAPGGEVASTTFTLSLKNSAGASCALAGTTKWDVALQLPDSAISTTFKTGVSVLLNQAPAATAAGGVAIQLNTSGGPHVRLENKTNSPFGPTLTNASTPFLSGSDSLTTTVYLVRASTGAITPGAFTATVPLIVWYK